MQGHCMLALLADNVIKNPLNIF